MRFPTHRPSLTEPSEVFTTWTHACSDVERAWAGQLRRTLPELVRWSDTELMCAWRLYTRASGTPWTAPPDTAQHERCNDFRMHLMVLTLSPRLRDHPVTEETYLEALDLIRSLKVRAGTDAGTRPNNALPSKAASTGTAPTRPIPPTRTVSTQTRSR